MKTGVSALILALAASGAHAMTDAQLRDVVDQRLAGDRTGACMALAAIDQDHAGL